LSLAVILDTDFLSAFLKIDRLSLVRDFYGASILRVPPAVYREVSMTSLVPSLAGTPWIQVEIPTTLDWAVSPDFRNLGKGEQEAILLARRYDDSLLLMNDLKAQRIAQRLGVNTVDIPAFLLSCKLSGHVDQGEIQALVTALQEKDRYGFRRDVLERLLS
jgi:predicted nucleic acid-binding protein